MLHQFQHSLPAQAKLIIVVEPFLDQLWSRNRCSYAIFLMHWATPEAMSPGKQFFFFCGKACVFQEGRTTFSICSDKDSTTLQWMLKPAQVPYNLKAFWKARDILQE